MDDAKKVLVGVGMDLEATFCPAKGAFDAVLEICVVGGGGRTFVKAHGNVGVELILDLDGLFGREEKGCAVDFVFEMDTIFGDVFLLVVGERKDLVATRIGENGAVPIHKTV